MWLFAIITKRGLSPYTRGNHIKLATNADNEGSIPVHTGEPRLALRLRLKRRVYPRTHGGTAKRGPKLYAFRGLSPYTRGNLIRIGRCRQDQGSIPVHTGEPAPGIFHFAPHWVYPRTHGGTESSTRSVNFKWGLSPYTRGNRAAFTFKASNSGSIPVHTGEPASLRESVR